MTMYDRIVVPLDGSDIAELALSEATKIARLSGAPLFLVRVVDFAKLHGFDPYGTAAEYLSYDAAMQQEEQAAVEYLEKQLASLRSEDNLVVESEVVRGPAARAILAASIPGDLIVMASHGRGGVPRWVLGSVAEDITRHSKVPVLLIRAKPDELD